MKKVVILIAVLTMSLGSLAAAEEWDLNTDMNATTNEPNGIWTYCWAEGDPNDPDPNSIPIFKGVMDNEYVEDALWIKIFEPGYTGNWNPHIFYNLIGISGHGMKPGWRYFDDPLVDPEARNRQAPAVIRWTAPAFFATPGAIAMAALCTPMNDDGPVEIYIVKSVGGDPLQRTVLLDQKDITLSNPLEFGTTCEIAEGDTIDFMVGPQGPQDDIAWNNTDFVGVSITISDQPLPPTCPNQLPMDFNWDCYVNLADFSVFAQSWLDCNNLNDENCK